MGRDLLDSPGRRKGILRRHGKSIALFLSLMLNVYLFVSKSALDTRIHQLTSKPDLPGPRVSLVPEDEGAEEIEPALFTKGPLVESGETGEIVMELDGGSFKIAGSIFLTLQKALGAEMSRALSIQLARVFVWHLDLRKDTLKGDVLKFIFGRVEEAPGVRILAAEYHSRKYNLTIRAFYYKPPSAKYASYYDESGSTLERRFFDAPLEDYEDMTSAVQSTTGKKGVLFRATLGSKVLAPYRARVLRKNWNIKKNGLCVELEYVESGVHAFFMQLSKIYPVVVPGALLEVKTPFAEVGSSSPTAPSQLYYRLEDRVGRDLDPFEFQRTYSETIPYDDRPTFEDRVRRLVKLMDNMEPGTMLQKKLKARSQADAGVAPPDALGSSRTRRKR